MAAHPVLNNRKAIKTASGVSERAVGYILQEDGGNPTLAHLEALAGAYHLEVWELLMPGLDVEKVVTKISPQEHQLHKTIEASMKKLGIKEYKLRR